MELIRVEIPQHIRKVQLSAKQRPVYFEWNGLCIKGKKAKIHRRWLQDQSSHVVDIKIEDLKDKFFIGVYHNNKIVSVTRDTSDLPTPAALLRTKDKYRLVIQNDEQGYTPMLCNSKVVDTPRMKLIKGQDFYNSTIKEHQRGTIMNAIKECYKPYLVNLPVIQDYPVRMVCEVHDTIRNVYDLHQQTGTGKPWDVDNYAYPYLKAFPDLMQALGKIRNDDRLNVTQPPSAIFCPIEHHRDRKLVFIISKDERELIANNETYRNYHNPVQLGEGIEAQVKGVEEIVPLTDNPQNNF